MQQAIFCKSTSSMHFFLNPLNSLYDGINVPGTIRVKKVNKLAGSKLRVKLLFTVISKRIN